MLDRSVELSGKGHGKGDGPELWRRVQASGLGWRARRLEGGEWWAKAEKDEGS